MAVIERRKYLQIWFSFFILICTSFISTSKITDPFFNAQHLFAMIGASFSIFILCVFYIYNKSNFVIELNLLDFSILGFTVYILTHESISGNIFYNNIQALYFFVCTLIYFLLLPFIKKKSITHKGFFLNGIIIIAIGQSIYGLLQYFNLIQKIEQGFSIYGAFGNPGPYATFLSALLPITLFASFNKENGFTKYGGFLASLLILIVLPLTMARTSWVSAIAIITFVLFSDIKFQLLIKKLLKKPINKIASVFLLVSFSLIIIFGLVSFKKDSVSGRVFVWEISLNAIKEKPLFGHGLSTFSTVHNEYQAAYFNSNPEDKKNGYIADCVNFAFNEFIHFTLELGVIGLLFWVFILFLCFYYFIRSPNRWSNDSLKIGMGIIISISISSLFSYPLKNIPTLFMLYTGMLMISASHKNSNRIVFIQLEKIKWLLSSFTRLFTKTCIINLLHS